METRSVHTKLLVSPRERRRVFLSSSPCETRPYIFPSFHSFRDRSLSAEIFTTVSRNLCEECFLPLIQTLKVPEKKYHGVKKKLCPSFIPSLFSSFFLSPFRPSFLVNNFLSQEEIDREI